MADSGEAGGGPGDRVGKFLHRGALRGLEREPASARRPIPSTAILSTTIPSTTILVAPRAGLSSGPVAIIEQHRDGDQHRDGTNAEMGTSAATGSKACAPQIAASGARLRDNGSCSLPRRSC